MKRDGHLRLLALAGALLWGACPSAPPPRGLPGSGGGSGGQSSGGTTATGGSPSGTGGAGSGGATGTGGAATGGAATGGSGSGGGGVVDAGTGGAAGGSGSTDAATEGGAATPDAPHGGDGPSVDAPDAGGAGGSPACAGLVCEDFESGQIDSAKWNLVAKGGTFTVQQQRVNRGKYAGQVHGGAGPSDDWALLVVKNVPAALKGATTFGRSYVYVAPDATASIHVQLTFAGREGTGSATGPAPFTKLRYMETASYGGRWQLGFDLLDVSPLVEEVSYSTGRLPTGAWACLEWQFQDQPDRIILWINGTQASTFDNTNVAYASPGPVPKSGQPLWDGKSSDLVGGFDTFGIGFHDWHPQKAFDIYYDDVVLDAKRIGCLP